LHAVHSDRQAVLEREVLRMFCQYRREHAWDDVSDVLHTAGQTFRNASNGLVSGGRPVHISQGAACGLLRMRKDDSLDKCVL
jgi:hypothetical protein